MNIVLNNNIEKYRVYIPSTIIIPPKNSEKAAIKPQKTGAKCIPMDPMPYAPNPVHFSTPPIILGYP